MRDDDPWKPPSDGAEPPDAPSLPSAPPPVPPEAAPVIPPPPVGTTPPDPPQPFASPVADGPEPLVIAQSNELAEPPRRSKWVVGGATAAVVAVGLAGIFAITNLTRSSNGGAASPEELGFSLLQAVENEDVLGVVDALSPGERDVFRDPLVDLVDELTRLEILSDDADLSRILGVDVEFSNEAVNATSTNVSDITNIDLRADAVLTFDGAQVPLGDLITDNLDDDTLTEMRGTRLTETDELDIRLTAIEEDGRWYFSVFHTIAEFAREEAAPGSLIPVEGIGADGADTPEAAFNSMLDRIEALDLAGLLRTLNPGEAAALQRYAPLFIDDAAAALAEVPLDWEVTSREFRVDESGDSATIFLDGVAIDGTIEGDPFSIEYADGCVSAEALDESFEQCPGTEFDDSVEVFDEYPETARLFDTLIEAFADIEEVGLEMRASDGLWYVSPTATMTEGFLAALRALDRSELDAIIEQAPSAVNELGYAISGGTMRFPGGIGDDEFFDDSPTVDAGTDVAPPALWDDCYGEQDPAAAVACFEQAVDRGDIDASSVPVYLRHPECGYEAAWSGDFYSLPDEEFMAVVEVAQPCFLDLVERGLVDEYELPNEILYLECFEGRNWYNVFDDPDYDERYFECIGSGTGAGLNG